jgi:hypothetical protein
MNEVKVRIVGLGAHDDEVCVLTGEPATGYIEGKIGDMLPCKLSVLGPGMIGEAVTVPVEYHSKLSELLS